MKQLATRPIDDRVSLSYRIRTLAFFIASIAFVAETAAALTSNTLSRSLINLLMYIRNTAGSKV